MIAESINEPAIGDLNGDGHDDIVVADQRDLRRGPGPGAGTSSCSPARPAARRASYAVRPYAVNGATGGPFMPGWPVKLDGAIQTTLPLIGPGQDPSIAKIGGQPVIVASTTGSATLEELDASGDQVRTPCSRAPTDAGSNATDRSGAINLFESAVARRPARHRHARHRQVRAVAQPTSRTCCWSGRTSPTTT